MSRALLVALIAGLVTAVPSAQGTRLNLTFAAQNKNPAFDGPVDEYRRIWAAEGDRIIQGMEQVTGLKFPGNKIKAEVYEGTSFAGLLFNRQGVAVSARDPMLFRASYPAEEKKGTLVHELGHRMNLQLRQRPTELDEHRLLFLYLYDLYVNLYGKEFADREVAFGRTLKGLYDYDAAWTWALAMNREERSSRFGEVVKANRK